MKKFLLSVPVALLSSLAWGAPLSVSGVYPHLRTFNKEGECGTGAVVPWADRLWVISYGPHLPQGSSDKLYEITPDLQQIIRPESVGGTPANRFIHKKSDQLLIGPYLIARDRSIRVISPSQMFGRLTGTAAHLTDPDKVYYATMEEGLYEVDVRSLSIKCLIQDGNLNPSHSKTLAPHHFDGVQSRLPGYHGKGLYTGQGQLIYANNGDRDPRVRHDPTVPSGALGFWNGTGDWRLIRRNQFTEVTGPGGIEGAKDPVRDPVWAVGWDSKSLILMILDGGIWQAFRLPKGSHSYDGSHGWNTEWPRIRDIGQSDLLMTMHGTFWKFPKTFSVQNTAGIVPLSNYLRVVGDFARWQGRIVLGCDDSAKNEFLNKRTFKNEHATPPQSNSNLWFVDPGLLSSLGPVIGRGSVWLRDKVEDNAQSDPFLTNGYSRGTLHITHRSNHAVSFHIEADRHGNGDWTPISSVRVESGSAVSSPLPSDRMPAWVRIRAENAAEGVTAQFHLSAPDPRPNQNHADFAGLPAFEPDNRPSHRAVLRSLGADHIGVLTRSGSLFSVGTSLQFEPITSGAALEELRKAKPSLVNGISEDDASIILEEDGSRYRIPRGAGNMPAQAGGRLCREVATERDLLNAGGTFFELPARNAQGVAKIRPIATHLLDIDDYASQFGLMFIAAGPMPEKARRANAAHIFSTPSESDSVWAGVIDDLWKLGKPRGEGGPWKQTQVEANAQSDPYLMTGYDRKTLKLSHSSPETVRFKVEVDIDGTGEWIPYHSFDVESSPIEHTFPAGYGAYWMRVTVDKATRATAQLHYE